MEVYLTWMVLKGWTMINKLEYLKSHLSIILAGLIGAGLVLRLAGIAAAPFWYDESYSIYLTRLDLLTMVRVASLDYNPPLWELVLWPFVKILGESELAVRLPVIILALLSVWVAWKITKALGFKQSELLYSFGLISLLGYMFWVAQDARTYSLLIALYLGAFYFAITKKWLGLIACNGLILYCHAVGPFFFLTMMVIAGYINPESINLKKPVLFISFAISGLAFIPWLPVYLHAAGLAFWSTPVTLQGIIFSFYMAFFGGTLPENIGLLGIALIILSVIFACGMSLEPFVKRDWIRSPILALMVFALLPFLFMLQYSLIDKNIIVYRTLGILTIPFALWFGKALTPVRLTKTTVILPGLWTGILITGLLFWSPNTRGGDLREVANLINAQLQPGDIIYHATATSYLPFSLYLNTVNQYVMDTEENPGMLQTQTQNILGVKRASLETLPAGGRVFFIWSHDNIESTEGVKRMTDYVKGSVIIGGVNGWQFSPIVVYEKELNK